MVKRFAESDQKEEVVGLLNHPSPNALLTGVRMNSGPHQEKGVKTLLDTQVGRAGLLQRPRMPPNLGWTGCQPPVHLDASSGAAPSGRWDGFPAKHFPRCLPTGPPHSFICQLKFLKPKCLHSSAFLGLRMAFLKPPRLGEGLTYLSSPHLKTSC